MFHNCKSLLEFSIFEKKSEQEEEDENELKAQKELIFEQFAIGYKNISPNTNIENSTFTYYSNISKKENSSDNSILIYFYDYLAKETNHYGLFRSLFNNCRSLKILNNISKWKDINIFDMHGMFANCSSLNPFPDISEFNTSHTIYMSYLF